MRKAIGPSPFVVSGGGIFNGEDIKIDFSEGANVVTIGTALFGMNDRKISYFLPAVVDDVRNGTNKSLRFLEDVDMDYHEVRIEEVINEDSDFKVFRTDSRIDALPGQFVFAMLPSIGKNGKPDEKPFSVMDDDPFTLGVLKRGYFTGHFNNLKKGDSFFYRGPYGQGVYVPNNSEVVLVGGGCGIAGLLLLAKRFSGKANVTMFLGAKDKKNLSYVDEFAKYGWLEVATEDGSLGRKGLVTDLVRDYKLDKGSYFFNCGPKAMVKDVEALEKEYSDNMRISSSVDHITRCGFGGCGGCTNHRGERTCLDGPFMHP